MRLKDSFFLLVKDETPGSAAFTFSADSWRASALVMTPLFKKLNLKEQKGLLVMNVPEDFDHLDRIREYELRAFIPQDGDGEGKDSATANRPASAPSPSSPPAEAYGSRATTATRVARCTPSTTPKELPTS